MMEFPYTDPEFENEPPSGEEREDSWWNDFRFYQEMKRRYYRIHNKYYTESAHWHNQWTAHFEERRAASANLARAKAQVIMDYARKYGCEVFIETGTYFGETAQQMASVFEHVYTVEIEEDLYNEAGSRLQGVGNVTRYLGDSREMLPQMIQASEGKRRLFFVDAHWCQGGPAPDDRSSPARNELEAIFSLVEGPSVVLVDDARYFGGIAERDWRAEGYPEQSWVQDAAEAVGYKFKVTKDMIRLVRE